MSEKSDLIEAAKLEAETLRQQLSEELGHDPTDEELDEYIREHTESY